MSSTAVVPSSRRPMSESERVVIIGGGMGGLVSALALKHSGCEVLVIERDPEPPEIAPGSAFEDWKRSGVPQLRHTHIFLARLQSILREHHPELLAELLAEGFELSTVEQSLPTPLLEHDQPQASDVDLLHLWGRRATFEYVLRRHVGRLPNVRFLHGRSVEGLMVEQAGAELRVTGVELKAAGGGEQLGADLVIDAAGVRSAAVEWLAARGAKIGCERHPSHCGYYCRHFKQHDLSTQPVRHGNGSTMDYLVYGIFFAEHGNFSIAFACPDMDQELMQALKRPDGFNEACQQIPAIARWTSRAEPTSRVFGGAELANRWQHYPRAEEPQVLGFFPVGDGYIQTNPIYGRGCSSAFVQAHALAAALSQSADPRTRAQAYHRSVWALMRPHFDFCRLADEGFLARAKVAKGGKLSLREQFGSRIFERAFLPALEESPFVAREWLKMQQMGKASPPWVFMLVLLRMAWLWLKRVLSGRRWQLPYLGPTRAEMVRACSERLAQAGREESREETREETVSEAPH